jgi:hypothetical protein
MREQHDSLCVFTLISDKGEYTFFDFEACAGVLCIYVVTNKLDILKNIHPFFCELLPSDLL